MADAEEDITLVLDEADSAMEKTLESLRKELQRIRTGRASTSLLDGVLVDYYDAPTPLKQLANLTTPDPRLIVISPYDKSSLAGIEKAILASDLGLTPSNDGSVVRIAIPPLTEERRKDLVKQVKRIAEEHKIGVREEWIYLLGDKDNFWPADAPNTAESGTLCGPCAEIFPSP